MRLMSGPVRLLVQAGLLLAWAMPVVASLTVWQWLFDTQYGVVNWTLTRLGADYEGHSWLLDPLSFFFVATVIVVWMSVPFVAFTGYAALTQVSEDLTEAAELDGAGAWQRLRHVVLPSIRPVLLIIGLLQVIWDLRVFTQIYVLQKAGGVTRDTNLLGTYIYRLGIGGGDFGTAAAVAMFMLALTVLLTAPYVRLMLKDRGGLTLMARRPSAPVRIGANLAGLVIFAACAFPVYWMVNTSLLPRREINAPDPTWSRSAARSTTTAGCSTAAGSSTRSG